MSMREAYDIAVVPNVSYTKEDAEFLTRGRQHGCRRVRAPRGVDQ